MIRRAFKVDEANAMIPQLETILLDLDRTNEEMREQQGKLQILDALWGRDVESPDNPDYGELQTWRRARQGTAHRIERLVSDEILGQGLRFPQGGIQYGLIDFPTTYEGRWVYLCWRRGEPAVRYFHEVTAGYGGRTEITSNHAAAIGREDDPALQDDSVLDF